MNPWCRVCAAKNARKWAKANPEKGLESTRKWQKKNPEKAAAQVLKYRAANPKKFADHAANRRARNAECHVENVDRSVVLAQNKALCGICGLSVDPDDFHVDHILPLGLGEHSYANVIPAHPYCNRSKWHHIHIATNFITHEPVFITVKEWMVSPT